MIIALITAICIIPFMAEWFAAPKATTEGATQPDVTRSKVHYILVPLMGLIVYGTCVALTSRIWLGLAGSVFFYGIITAVSNKKYEVLRDPFNAHDFDNLRNLYIYPEFYISYIGWPVLIAVISAFTGLLWLAVQAEAPIVYFADYPQYLNWAASIAVWLLIVRFLRGIAGMFFTEEKAAKNGINIKLHEDIMRFGLFPTIMLYRILIKQLCDKPDLRNRVVTINTKPDVDPADIIVIQGESYFDLRRLFLQIPDNIKKDWPALTALEKAGVQTGRLSVPAWGAYTMQTEFSFLSALPNSVLGIDKINPYMRLAQAPITTIASALRRAGYKTICLHPAKKEFFRRSDVIPNMGFDEFVGLEAFSQAPKYGKYISDDALADEIDNIVNSYKALHNKPIFVFAITIESHGPWAPGRLATHLDEEQLTGQNPTGDRAFALYQQHMENLLALYKRLTLNAGKAALSSPRTVALYSDHMPALDPVFKKYGFNDAQVDYLLWSSHQKTQPAGQLYIENFAEIVLQEAGLEPDIPDARNANPFL